MYDAKVAVMATGGMDSTTLIYSLVEQGKFPQVLTVDYGHVAFSKQIEMLEFHIAKLRLFPIKVIKIAFPPWQCRPGLFEENYIPSENDCLEDWDQLRYQDFFIEGRNMIMLAYGIAYCSAHKIDQLFTGYLYGEKEWSNRRTYKLMTGDNSPQFVDAINIMTSYGFSHQVRVRAPFYEQLLSKKDVYVMGKRLGVDFDKTYSCYFIPACGKCDNCLLRKDILGKE